MTDGMTMMKGDLFGAGVPASERETIVAECIPSAALSQHAAIIGKTGSGKTSTSKLAVEQVVAGGFRVCILDTIKSDWWGITSSADGSQPGLPFKILGGPRGHVPLHSSAGSAIGQIVGSGKLPLSILDMAERSPNSRRSTTPRRRRTMRRSSTSRRRP
ncbi:hypothetical protein Hden_2995 [Hyphomicrobium denitrificans ATCC 51888]|uniref:Helicase HerA central domain-containing protein n=1 Tax=Hyphomicrobium denitrificans (strain ATCC 51888 / DSM 1869 / NCIMB 11706 / TK 0415) TaxID=582899 RepID=D8JVD6_HYPDA|nr:DUF87 domain-containing protein [Hyphomicrobium denitrificans]ADJ24790.1 hypothetical protein Hden_2995 [Hyphomicrobium denitrificans ATCC 51888]